ncbi:MAG: sugar ABC transporter permease [Planctomycetota bacterium]
MPAGRRRLAVHNHRRLMDWGTPLRRTGFMGRFWRARADYLFLAPALLPFAVFILWPLLHGLALSFLDLRMGAVRQYRFAGIEHFARLVSDERFRCALANTFFFVAFVVPLALVLSIVISVLIDSLPRWTHGLFRFAFYLPVVAGGVCLGMVWVWIYDPAVGLLNHVLARVGLIDPVRPVEWLGLQSIAVPSMAIVVLTWILGQPIVIFLAALGGIPPELYEAARIDGASGFAQFWHVTLPLLRPATLFVAVTQTIGVFQVFVVVFLLAQNNPSNWSLVYYMYRSAFYPPYDFGYAAAQGVVLVTLIAVIAVVQYRLWGKEIEY